MDKCTHTNTYTPRQKPIHTNAWTKQVLFTVPPRTTQSNKVVIPWPITIVMTKFSHRTFARKCSLMLYSRAALHRIDLARSLFVACTQVSTSSGHGESRNLRTARDLLTSGLEHVNRCLCCPICVYRTSWKHGTLPLPGDIQREDKRLRGEEKERAAWEKGATSHRQPVD